MASNKTSTPSTIVKKKEKSNLYKAIESDLLAQLQHNGTTGRYYKDLVTDYMNLWITKALLIDDIKERGVRTEYDNGGGQKGYTKNNSVELLVKTNAQMLKLLSELGIKPSQSIGDDDVL